MRLAGAVAIGVALATPVTAADCPFEKARYAQPETGYGLAFRPVRSEDGIVSNAFALVLPQGKGSFEGVVRWNNGEARPDGYITHGCPDEPTDEEALRCTGWSGVMYGVTGDKIEMLQSEGDPAPDQVLLTGLGRSMWYSGLLHEAQVGATPWDVFAFAGCTSAD